MPNEDLRLSCHANVGLVRRFFPFRTPHSALRPLLLLSLLGLAFQSYPDVSQSTIVRIRKNREQGTGVVISPDGWILTAEHVVNYDPATVSVEWNGKRYRATDVYFSPSECFDLALVKIPIQGAKWVPVSQTPPQVGETVFYMGYPLGEYKRAAGFVLQYVTGDKQTGRVMTSFTADRGASGSPLITLRGRICGILSAAAFDERNQPIADFWISAKHIQRLLDDAKDAGKLR